MSWKIYDKNKNYSVNEYGDVKNNATGAIKRPFKNVQNGYLYVDLWSNNKVKKYAIHRMIAETFIPNPQNKPTVDHIDGNRTNNAIENLRWATYSEQNSRFNTHGVRSEKIKVTNEITKEQIFFDSITDAAAFFDTSISNVSQMLKKCTYGKRGKMRYYLFEYLGRQIQERVTTIPKGSTLK